MAQLVLTNAKILYHGADVSGDLNQVQISLGAAMLDDTVFGDTFESNQAGLQKVSANLTGFYRTVASGNPDGQDNTMFAALGVDNRLLTIFPDGFAEGTTTEKGYAFLSTASKYTPFNNLTVGDLMAFSFTGECRHTPCCRAVTLKDATAAFAGTGSGTKYQVGSVSAGQYLYAGLHVLGYTGTSPTLDLTIQSDADASAGGETTRITFAQVSSATGGFYATRVAGPITDTYWRTNYTVGGSASPGFKFVAWIAIQ